MKKINRGWISLEMSIGLILIMLALTGASAMMRQYLDNQEWNAIAQKSTVISDAARRYIADNYPSLLSQAPTGQTLPVTVATLINSGYLRPGYSDTNTYGQQYEAVVMKNSKQTDQLDSYVITQKGNPLNDKGRRTVAARINGMGGYTQNNQAVGAFSGWQRPLSQLGLTIPDGHIVVDLTNSVLNTASDESDRLYRFRVNTRPDLNQMHTDIDMGGNALNNASTVTATSNINSLGGWIVTDNNKGWMNETHNGGFYMDDDNWVKSLNKKGIMTGGQIHAEGLLSTGDVLHLGAINIAGTSCPTVGDISRDDNGGLLSCQYHVWTGSDIYPTGSPIPWPSPVPPSGYLMCNGQAFNKMLNPKLASVYPSGILPDLRGVFIRGWDNGRGVDPGRGILTYQADQSDMVISDGGKLQGHHNGMDYYFRGKNENRPKNVTFNYIVKAG